MAKINKLNIFLSDLAVLNIKIHNVHWNLIGENFLPLHHMTEKLYQMLQLHFDETAEALKMQGEMPLASMADYLKYANIQEADSCPVNTMEALQILAADCDILMQTAKDIRDEADEKDNFLVANLLEDYLALYAKHSWMIKAMLAEQNID